MLVDQKPPANPPAQQRSDGRAEMSRSEYSDALDQWELIRYRGAVASAFRGKRGQAFLRELADALDAMPIKRLIAHDFERDGEFCTIGVVGAARGMDMGWLDNEDPSQVGSAFGIATAMAAEIEFENDERYTNDAPELRWARMRAWVSTWLTAPAS